MEEWSESPVKRSYAHYEDEREDKDEKDDEDDKSDRDNRDERDDLEERVGSRHKRRRGSDSEAPGHGASDIEYRILCPVSKIGAVIGKGGSIIKSLRLDTKAKIKVEDVVHGSDERVIYISSAPGCDREAKDKDSRDRDGHRGCDRDEMLCPAQLALFRIHHCITEREDHTPTSDEDVDDDDEPPTQVTARLLVSDSQVGCLIGKGGRIIEQMRKDIAAQIRVLPKASLPPCAYPSDELVQLSGTPALVKKALHAVSSKLYDNPTRERSHRPSGLSHGPGGGMYSSLHAPVSMMGIGHHSRSRTRNSGSMRSSRTDGSPEEELTVSILCPKDKIGSMIGKGGTVVRKLREDSGAKIKVCDQVDDSDERVIQISAIEYMDSYASPVLEAVMQVNRRLAEISADREGRNPILSIRLLVRAHQIGCLLGKGGQIITEMRKSSRANIRIPPKDELPLCADEGSELVQVSGEAPMVEAALIQVLNRLRSNLFKGRDVGHVITGMNRHGGGYGGRDDPGSPGGYSHDFGNYSTSPGATHSSKDSRRRQR